MQNYYVQANYLCIAENTSSAKENEHDMNQFSHKCEMRVIIKPKSLKVKDLNRR